MSDAPGSPEATGRSGRDIARSSGARAGLDLALATGVFALANALYNLICIRFLGSARYGDVAAIAALGAVFSLPTTGVQNLLARDSAALMARGNHDELRDLFRSVTWWTLMGALAVCALLVALSGVFAGFTDVASTPAMAVGLAIIVPIALAAVLSGFLQGMHRFRAFGASLIGGGVARVGVVLAALFAGWGVTGAVSASVISTSVSVAICVVALRHLGWGWSRPSFPHQLVSRSALVVVLATLAYTSLTNLDVVLANALLTTHEGGVYAAAAFAAKLILMVSVIVATVLLPKAAARAVAGRVGVGILLASVVVTFVAAMVVAAVLFVVPTHLVVTVFGPDFGDARALLGPFGVAMALGGVVNIYLFFYLAHHDFRFPALVGLGAVAQAVAIALWHPSAEAVVWWVMAAFALILVVHEAVFPYGVVRSVRILRAADAFSRLRRS